MSGSSRRGGSAKPEKPKSTEAPKAEEQSAPGKWTLTNKSRKMRVFNLSTQTKRVFPVVTTLRDGTGVGEMKPRMCADSLTLLAGESRTVSDEVYSSPEVQSAIKNPNSGIVARETKSK